MSEPQRAPRRGYGNIYTPHAGSMIIQVQRESGLANRTIVLSQRKVRFLRFLLSRIGLVLVGMFVASWIYLATQTVRVPVLERQVAALEEDSRRLDTLQVALDELHRRYDQVVRMLGLPVSARAAAMVAGADPSLFSRPELWPLEGGFVTRGSGGASRYQPDHPGVDIAVPTGTEIRAAGSGIVVEVHENEEYGQFLRVQHSDGYETLYGHASSVRVRTGDQVETGQVVALSGNSGRSTGPHLHFEVRRNGQPVDPMQVITKGK